MEAIHIPALSLLAGFDDINRCDNILNDGILEQYFLQFLKLQEKWQQQRLAAETEASRLQKELQDALKAISVWEAKFTHARKLLDAEKKYRIKAERERDNIEKQMNLARDLLFNDRAKVNNETLEKLAFLNSTSTNRLSQPTNEQGRMATINEMNSTGNLLSDQSFSRSEDDLDESVVGRRSWLRHRPSAPPPPPPVDDPPVKKRRSSADKEIFLSTSGGRVIATTTVTVDGRSGRRSDGKIVASSVIEAKNDTSEGSVSSETEIRPTPKSTKNDFNIQIESKGRPGHYVTNIKRFAPSAPTPSDIDMESAGGWTPASGFSANTGVCSPRGTPRLRQHAFVNKTIMKPDPCVTCGVKMRFAKTVAKCGECRAICHLECKDKLPLPCVPSHITPNTNPHQMGTISDYTPGVSPMVPALIIHCVNEIEARGVNEIGLYRVPGSEKEVRALKEKFLRGRGTPPLNNIDINVICGCVKDFLRSLREPLITYSLWSDFVSATEMEDKSDIEASLYQAISELPQPNRDTLAFMILHLQRVAEWVECKMPIENLAKVFGPTIVGYSDNDPDPNYMYQQTRQQVNVMEHLMNISSDYWLRFVAIPANDGCGVVTTTPILRTPSLRPRLGTAPLTTPRRDTFSRNRHTPYQTPSTAKTQQKGYFFYTPSAKNKY